ncbi:MAG: DUF4173 domain-containing protein [Eubacterium sp.]|nr:DUF4173 domain-containing protein [Eubacterium sp.]
MYENNNYQQGQGNPYPGYQQEQYYNNSYWKKTETAEQQAERASIAGLLGKAALIYAVIVTFCLYKNFSGITMPVFAVATAIFMCYILKSYNVKLKKASWFYIAIIVLLSISNFLTGNSFYIFFNTVGILLMIFVFLLHNVYDDSRWNFSKTFFAVFEAFFGSFGCLDDYSKDMKAMKSRSNLQNAVKNEASDGAAEKAAEGTSEKTADGSAENVSVPEAPKKGVFGSVLLGLIISIPVVGIILTLLTHADVVFKTMIEDYLNIDFHFGTIFGIAVTFVISFLASYCIMRFFSKKRIAEEVKIHKNWEPVVAITVLTLISVIYLAFSMIQILYLFWGGMELPEDYTYAEYAREGFFQLLVVCILNVLIVLFVQKFFKDSKVLKLLMTVISLCTYIMIASSAMRMILYIEAYHLSFLRILVLWTLAVLSLLLVGVIISIFKETFPLFKYGVVIMSVMYLVLSFSHTDYIIARYNLSVIKDDYLESSVDDDDRYYDDYDDYDDDDYYNDYDDHDDNYIDDPELRHKDDRNGSYQDSNGMYGLIDYDYLTTLSTDAAPAIAERCPERVREQYFDNNKRAYKDKSIRHFNVSRYIARNLSKEVE